MGHVTFDRDEDNVVSGQYSAGRGPVLRSEKMEVTKIAFPKGKGAELHRHPEEQVMYVLSGRLQVTCDGERYEVGPGEATFNPANSDHGVSALEDTVALSFKNLVDPTGYEKTGDLA